MSNYWLDAAIFMAQIGWNQGGVPIGSALANATGTLVSMGHNNRHQWDDPTAHGEIDNMRNAGNRTDWKCCTLASTLSCCSMCSGMIVLYKIPNVIAGEDKTFQGPTKWLQENDVNVNILQSGKQHNMCVKMMKLLQTEDLELWNRDIGVTTCKNQGDCTNPNTYAFPDTATCSNNTCGCTSAQVPTPSNPAMTVEKGSSCDKIRIALLSTALLGLILLIILRLKH
jgi:cytosine deaminase